MGFRDFEQYFQKALVIILKDKINDFVLLGVGLFVPSTPFLTHKVEALVGFSVMDRQLCVLRLEVLLAGPDLFKLQGILTGTEVTGQGRVGGHGPGLQPSRLGAAVAEDGGR